MRTPRQVKVPAYRRLIEASESDLHRKTSTRRTSKCSRTAGAEATIEMLEQRTLMSAGDLDHSFNGTGMVTTTIGLGSTANATAVQSDGKIVVAGTVGNGSGGGGFNWILARYLVNGTLDTTFGQGNGIEVTDFLGGNDQASAVAIAPNGDLYEAGFITTSAGLEVLTVARFDSNGHPDSSFAGGTINFGSNLAYATGVAVQSNGAVVVAGTVYDGASNGRQNWVLARFTPAGSLDATFGQGNGIEVTDFTGQNDVAEALALQSNGSIIEAGYITSSSNEQYMAAVRFDSNGHPDSSWQGGGIHIGGSDNIGAAVAVQSDGKVVLAGTTDEGSGGGNENWVLARFDTDGQLDTSFGQGNGVEVTDFLGYDDAAFAVAIAPSGKILEAGSFSTQNSTSMIVQRFDTSGHPDPSWMGGEADFGGLTYGSSVSIAPNGRVVEAGSYQPSASDSEIIAVASFVGDSATISGIIFNDANGNGTKDSGEAGLSGITVYNDANNNGKLDSGELSTTTNSSGVYTLANLAAGSYKIRQVLPSGKKQTAPENGFGYTIGLATGQNVTNDNFGEQTTATGGSVSGTVTGGKGGETVYLDANNDKTLDNGELAVTVASDLTYKFTNVPAGAYIIRQILPSGYTQTSPASNGGIHITVANGSNLTGENFTDKAPIVASIAGNVFSDANGDGSKDNGEGGVGSGWIVYLDANNNSALDSGEVSTTTDSSGNYKFAGLVAGTYKVRVIRPSGWTQTTPTNNFGQTVTLSNGQAATGENFGERHTG